MHTILYVLGMSPFLQETIGLFTRKVKGVRHPETGPFQTFTVCESLSTVTKCGYVVLNITAFYDP